MTRTERIERDELRQALIEYQTEHNEKRARDVVVASVLVVSLAILISFWAIGFFG